jgi:hypothetical protein
MPYSTSTKSGHSVSEPSAPVDRNEGLRVWGFEGLRGSWGWANRAPLLIGMRFWGFEEWVGRWNWSSVESHPSRVICHLSSVFGPLSSVILPGSSVLSYHLRSLLLSNYFFAHWLSSVCEIAFWCVFQNLYQFKVVFPAIFRLWVYLKTVLEQLAPST